MAFKKKNPLFLHPNIVAVFTSACNFWALSICVRVELHVTKIILCYLTMANTQGHVTAVTQ